MHCHDVSGLFAIGDTIYTGNTRIAYPGIPSFSPEKFAYIRNPNPSTYKKFQKVFSHVTVLLLTHTGKIAGFTLLICLRYNALQYVCVRVMEYRYNADSNLRTPRFIYVCVCVCIWGCCVTAVFYQCSLHFTLSMHWGVCRACQSCLTKVPCRCYEIEVTMGTEPPSWQPSGSYNLRCAVAGRRSTSLLFALKGFDGMAM